ncbi:endonuclease/exonuclease/phosphatase family protein [Niabella beijingensis]|uniref:endonuclease/exonuclease/phosphatase family protein n=1 Tax=Niabella beijingensis TaxID=2872700 RepID=UPI001CC05A8C|nr:endonuclease/exonuclease/phosphatase family protein [Niabella beijingensis]MBZ4190899.1 endonuclease/exonuclease/phosphatase family protein [Niabella beijingensis]
MYVLFFFLCACSKEKKEAPEVDPPEQKEVTVKTMTYNIYGARSGGIPDLQAIADVIKRANPELVALQEVDKFTTRNAKNGDIARELARLTDMDYFFAKAIDTYGGEYGDAVLSKLPVKEKKAYNLEVDPALGGERRSVARILVEKDGKPFYFISTHFDHLSDERNRLRQAQDFVALVRTFDKPVIVGADFNALPASNTIGMLRGYFSLGCLNGDCTQPTFSTTNPNRTIDYLIYAPLNAFTVKLYSVYDWANKESDHFPVQATFTVK